MEITSLHPLTKLRFFIGNYLFLSKKVYSLEIHAGHTNSHYRRKTQIQFKSVKDFLFTKILMYSNSINQILSTCTIEYNTRMALKRAEKRDDVVQPYVIFPWRKISICVLITHKERKKKCFWMCFPISTEIFFSFIREW